MKIIQLKAVLAAVAAMICIGCSANPPLKEIQRVRAGELDVVLLSSDGVLHQKGTFTIEFRSAKSGDLVNVDTVRLNATMPMPGMAPMFGSIQVQPTESSGRYTASASLDMSGGWRMAIDWDGPTAKGSTALTGTVQ